MVDELSMALECHQRGLLDEAASLYQGILHTQPDHPDALHLLGVIALQQGDPTRAIGTISRALVLNPSAAAYHTNLGEAHRRAGQLDQAIACGRTALRLQPAFAEAANNLGMALIERGELDEALVHLREALRLRPEFAQAACNIGDVLRLKGDVSGALSRFHLAVKLDATLAQAHSNLGQLLLERRQLPEALNHCREAVRLQPALAEAHGNLGNVLRELGRLAEAKDCYAQALRLNPHLAILYNNMGQALQEEGRLADVLTWYARGLELEPNLASLHANLASLRAEQANYDEAISCYETALSLDPHDAGAHNGLSWVRHQQGRYPEAEAGYRKALHLNPGFAPAHSNLGTLHEELGQFAEAQHRYREALRHDPRDVRAWSQLATLLRAALPEQDIAALRLLLTDADLAAGNRSALLFGLAHVLDARGSYDEAGAHLLQANALALADNLQRGQAEERDRHRAFVDRMIATSTPEFFERVRGFGSDTERPVFIFGLPRSGTTLTEQILAAHSQVFGAGEQALAGEAFMMLGGDSPDGEAMNEVRAFDGLTRLDESIAYQLATRHLEQLQLVNASAARVADKIPDNYLYLGLLAALFPRAKFIHCRRDLRDVAVSCFMTNFRNILWANDPDHIAARFHEYQRLMDHWQRVLPVAVLDVDYEQTVSDLEGVARRLVAWCGLDWEPACCAFHKGKQPVRTASVRQVRQRVYTHSAGRWRNYEHSLCVLFAHFSSTASRHDD